jgi:glycine/D-amino acid oxidase-like deaminating enzyme
MKNLFILIYISLAFISCQTSEKIEDIVIIGGGLMGSSTAWELSKYGQNVLLIEQQDSIYTYGSSFGEARISRSLGPKENIYSFLQQTSVSETNDLIDYLNTGEEEIMHTMEDIYTTAPITYIYYKSQLKEVEELLNGQTDKYEYASNTKEALKKFGMIIPDTTMVVREFKQFSGTLNPKVLIQKLHTGITKSGNRIRYNEKVTGLKKINGVYEIEVTSSKTGKVKTILSKKVVAAAGPYNGLLIQEIAPYFSELITPKRLFLSFLKIDSNKYDSLAIEQKKKLKEFYPVANLNSEIFYSMIEKFDEEDSPLLKIGGHFLRTEIEDLDAVWAKELTSQEIQWSKENTAHYLSLLNLPLELSDLEFIRGYSCVYSLTSSEIPYVTNIIENGTIVDSSFVLIGGMSGVGAKGSLTYGLIAANLLLNIENDAVIYQKTKAALGSERLMKDIKDINE